MNIGRIFASAVIRKSAYLLVAAVFAVLLQFCGISKVYAQDYSGCNTAVNGSLCPDQGSATSVAFEAARLSAAYWVSECVRLNQGNCAAKYPLCPAGVSELGGIYAGKSQIVVHVGNQSCGAYLDTKYYLFPSGETCSKRNVDYPPGDTMGMFERPDMTCAGGCKISGTFGTTTIGGVGVVTMSNRNYTGESCQVVPTDPFNPIEQSQREAEDSTKTPAPECRALGGGQTGCVKPNGQYCATASTGKTFCWSPNETGTKTDGDKAQVKSPVDQPVKKPDVLIPDTDWQRRDGHQVTNTSGGTTVTNNITNFNQVPGAGSANNSTGNNNADGSGNTSGNGSSSGGGTGTGDDEEGDEDSAADSGSCEVAPACSGNTLKCLHLKFQWRIQCNTRKDKITNGGSCTPEDIPVCVGEGCSAAEYSGMLQTWRARCEVQADRDRAGNDASSGDADAAADDLEGVKDGLWGGDGVTPTFDRGKVSLGGGALFPDVPLGDGTWTAPPELYSSLDKIKVLVIAAFMIWGFFVLWKN